MTFRLWQCFLIYPDSKHCTDSMLYSLSEDYYNHKFTWLSFDDFPYHKLSIGGGAKFSAKCPALFWTHGRLFCAIVIWEEKVNQTISS